MKASTFIKTALIDQIQQIADLGLWYHISKLLPSGVEVLARVRYAGPPYMYDGNVFLPEKIENVVGEFYKEFAPEYAGKYSTSKEFFSTNPNAWLVSDQQGAENHLGTTVDGKPVIYVPQWFEDFKGWCGVVISKIEAGELDDIEVLKMGEE
jgi:hypothetical protein